MKMALKIQYLSDLHLEYLSGNKILDVFRKIYPIAPVLVIAGNVGNPFSDHYQDALSQFNTVFEKVFLVAGNHEYTTPFAPGKPMPTPSQVRDRLKSFSNMFNNVIVLDNSSYLYAGYRWVGTTLWTPKTNSAEHRIALNLLNFQLEDSAEPTIVISHYLPLYQLIDLKCKIPKYTEQHPNFYCHLDKLILKHQNKIKVWIHGHNHNATRQDHYNVPFICNGIGFEDENLNPSFDMIFTLESDPAI